MFNLKADYSDLQEQGGFEPLPTGNYECIIQNAQEQVTPNKKESLSLKLVVRNDLDQALPETNGAYHNRILFDNHWKRPIEGEYIYKVEDLLYVLNAVGVPEGTEINGVDELINKIQGQVVKVYVKKAWSEYNEAEENDIAPWSYERSDYPNSQHVFDKGEAPVAKDEDNPYAGTEGADIPEEDYPF